MNPYYVNITGSDYAANIVRALSSSKNVSAQQSLLNPETGMAYDFPKPAEIPRIHTEKITQKATTTEPPAITERPLTTSERLEKYTAGAVYAMKAGEALTNGFIANASGKMKKRNAEFQAEQNLRSAKLLIANQKEVSRAAQMDANVYKMQGAATKANQKVAMAQTGFAVGKGIYKTTLDTTDARTNYNVSAIILKGEMQNAELARQAGQYRAQAEIEKGNAKVAEIEGKAAMWNGILSAASYAAISGANFYVGKYGTVPTTSSKK